MFYWDTVETPRGVFTIVFHEKGIYRVFFPGQQEEPAAWPRRDLPWRELKRDLPRYLAGEKVSWEGYPWTKAATAILLAACCAWSGPSPTACFSATARRRKKWAPPGAAGRWGRL